MKYYALFLAFFAFPVSAHALGHVIIGNAPLGPGYDKEVLEAVNVEERLILYHYDYSLTFYFKGGPKAINLMMQRFVAIPADKREIIILAGPRKEHIWDKKPLEYDWILYVPINEGGFRGDPGPRAATLTIYIPEQLPPELGDTKNAKKWIADLGSDDFKTRALASKELESLGPPAAKVLREALKGKQSAEARDRTEKLLAGVSTTLRVDVLKVPDGLTVRSLDSQLADYRKAMTDKDPEKRGQAASGIAHLDAPVAEILPELEKMLKNDKETPALSGAAWGAYYLGADAKSLIPALRELGKSTDKNLATACQQAIENIEKPRSILITEPQNKKRAIIRKEIKEFVEGFK